MRKQKHTTARKQNVSYQLFNDWLYLNYTNIFASIIASA